VNDGGKEMVKRRLILIHPGLVVFGIECICFDIFCDPKELPPKLRALLKYNGYEMRDCKYVKMLGEEDYFISLDLCHSWDDNMFLLLLIFELVKLGFEVKYVDSEGDIVDGKV
jgi:hypothetical protein